VVLVVHGAFAIAVASGALAGEIESRAIALVLTRPIRRWQVAAAAAVVVVAGNAVLMALLWMGTALWTRVYDLGPVDLYAFAWVAGTGLAAFWAVGGVALLASAATSEAGRAAGIGAGFALGAYIANYLAELNPDWGWLAGISVFGTWDPQGIIRQGGGAAADLLLPLGVAVTALTLALIIFSRRDIAV
jgi:ABC-type transport system involved in multi-copper enzyme maturation permease subunit